MVPRHIYVHVPFCARRCSYCDFSIAVRRAVPVDEFLATLSRELALRVPGGERWPIDTLYIGGGTPSQLGPDGVARLMELLHARFELARGAEVTLEANPDDITGDAIRAWRAAGVNRLSIGSQSFDPRVLAWMHRTHSAEQIGEAVAIARDGGIPSLSLDLIFAVPDELARDWERDVVQAVALGPQHLSLYGLTVEPATPLGRWRARGLVDEAPEERYASEFLLAHQLLAQAGYEHYEVSNYALPGHRSRHNSSYWRRVPYAGFGPSAHSFDGANRRWNLSPYAGWVRSLEKGRDPVKGDEVLTRDSRCSEEVYLGLRVAEGMDVDATMALRVQPWIDAGWAVLDGVRLRLTPEGWLRLDALAADLTLVASYC